MSELRWSGEGECPAEGTASARGLRWDLAWYVRRLEQLEDGRWGRGTETERCCEVLSQGAMTYDFFKTPSLACKIKLCAPVERMLAEVLSCLITIHQSKPCARPCAGGSSYP